jgi:ribonuclease E
MGKGAKIKAPAIIYKEYAVVIRTIRDYFSADIDEVLVDSKEVCKEAKAFFKETMPKFEKRVKMHQEKRPIFSRYQIEEQIDGIYEKKVPLKSGGSLVIEPTEALVSVDVNSGKSTGERNVEDTAFRTNLEAVEEAARQLRLRDLGGLIVLDLIDMREMKHIKEVEKLLKDSLKSDKARVTVGRISQFGMLEMSRQRIKQTLEQGSVLDCPHCSGRGKVKGVENMAISFLRKVHAAAAKGTAAEVRGELPLEVAYYLLNRKKRELAQIENDYDIEVTIKGKPSFLMNQLELVTVKREKPLQAEAQIKAEAEVAEEVETEVTVEEPKLLEQPVDTTVDDGRPKKKRSSRKKVAVAQLEEPATEILVAEAVAETEVIATVAGDAIEASSEEPKKKRRRKRRKKAKSGLVGQETSEFAEGDEVQESAAQSSNEAAVPNPEEAAVEPQKKKKRRRRKRGGAKTGDAEAGDQAELSAAVTVVEPSQPEAPQSEPKPEKAKVRAPRKKAVAAELSNVETVEPPILPDVSALPESVKPKRSRAKKVAVEAAAETSALPVVAAVDADTPKPKRAPRKKKSEVTGGE